MLTKKSNFWNFQMVSLIILILLPLIYVFVLIQYSAMTVPFWDHAELIYWLSSWYEGNLSFSDLFAPHNHSRPFIYRFVMLSNAILTDWDIRSEYFYMFLAIYGTFAIHFFALKSLILDSSRKTTFLVVLLLISLILCSPVGHNNHWWSMMFQLNATNFFIAFGFLIVFLRPMKLTSHLLSAISLWVASFTLTNGLFAIFTVIIVLLISSQRCLTPNKFSIFWIVNLVFILVLYVPGLSSSGRSTAPNVMDLTKFVLAYIGSPVAGLIWFPFRNMFDIPESITLNAIVGFLLFISFSIFFTHLFRKNLRNKPASLIFLSFSIFAIISAFVTGLGRANFDDFGVSNANASRYSIFAAYMIIGQIYYVTVTFFNDESYSINSENRSIGIHYTSKSSKKTPTYRKAILFLVFCYIIASFISYFRGIKVYENAHNFNKELAQYYTWNGSPTDATMMIHPNAETVDFLKNKLQRLELGPYSHRSYYKSKIKIGDFQKAALFSEDITYYQQFTATKDRLKALRVTLVAPNEKQKATHDVNWTLEKKDNKLTKISSGKIIASQINDWESVRIKLPFLETSMGVEYVLTLSSDASDASTVGVALYSLLQPQSVNGVTMIENSILSSLNLTMNIELEYVD